MFSYSPRVHHFFIPFLFFVIGQTALPTSWRLFGWVMYVFGGFVAFVVGYAIVAEIKLHRVDERKTGPVIADDQSHLRPGANDDATVNVELWETPSRTVYFDMPATRAQLETLAVSLTVGETFSERRWTGKLRPFSVNQFRALRDALLARSMIEQVSNKDPRQGYRLTAPGRALFKRFIPSPTLQSLEPLQGVD